MTLFLFKKLHTGVFILPNAHLENKYIRRNIFIVQILNRSVSDIWIIILKKNKRNKEMKREQPSEQDPGPISSLFLRMRLPNSFIDVVRAIAMALFSCASNF